MTRYISQPVPVDRGAVRTDMETSLTATVPGLEVPAGSQLDFLLDTFASNSAEDRQIFTDVLAIIFRYSGEKIDRVAQRDATAATGVSTWTRTLADAQASARTVTQGTEITVTGLDGQPQPFQTGTDFTFQASKTVSGVSVANPAVVTTGSAHGLTTGQQVTISGVGGATAVNGTWTVTVLSGTTFSVPVNNAVAYTAGGTVYHVGTAAGAVGLIAVVAGEDGNGLQAGAAPSQTLTWLSVVALIAPTSGGVDAEGDDDYLDRLSDTRPLRATALILPDDFARFARNQAGIDRAMVLDNFNGTTTQSGHVTAIPVDSTGAALTAGAMTVLQALMQANTVSNLTVHVLAPTFTTVTVVFTGIAKTGWDTVDVETRAEQAVLDFLDPSRWGLPDSGDERLWLEKSILRFQDIVTVLNNVEGFDHYTALTINGGGSDLTMGTPGALPSTSSSASGTVTL